MQTFQETLTANLFSPASAFELTYIPMPNTLMVFVNGVYQQINFHFRTTNNQIIFTDLIPASFDVRANYRFNPAESIQTPDTSRTIQIQEVLNENQIEPASSFDLAQPPDPYSQFIFVNGIVQRESIDYSINGNVLTTNMIIPTSYNVFADYSYTYPIDVEPSDILPEGRRGSTTLNSAITSYELLAERIKMQLGFPVVRIELCDDQIYDFIDQAIEWYSKYAGYTEEYLMMDASKVYECGLGVRLDKLFTAHACFQCTGDESHLAAVSGQFFDYDMNYYRKVIDVRAVDPVQATGADTLFSLDYMFAQQTYFSYMLGNFGFDLTTWHILKEWLDLRKKMFATDPYVVFNNRTQYLKIIPEPVRGRAYIGVVSCYVEKSIVQMLAERWIFQYSLALTKISLAHVRGKFGQVQLFGGGGPYATDLMTQGIAEKDKLEQELLTNFGEAKPIDFICG